MRVNVIFIYFPWVAKHVGWEPSSWLSPCILATGAKSLGHLGWAIPKIASRSQKKINSDPGGSMNLTTPNNRRKPPIFLNTLIERIFAFSCQLESNRPGTICQTLNSAEKIPRMAEVNQGLPHGPSSRSERKTCTYSIYSPV